MTLWELKQVADFEIEVINLNAPLKHSEYINRWKRCISTVRNNEDDTYYDIWDARADEKRVNEHAEIVEIFRNGKEAGWKHYEVPFECKNLALVVVRG